MEVDGWYMLFFDKFAINHTFNNKITTDKTIQQLFASNSTQFFNNEAIEEFNKFGEPYIIPLDLDKDLYQVIMFMNLYDNDPLHIAKYTVIGINGQVLKKYLQEKKSIPNENFLINVCRFHILYNKFQQNGSLLDKNSESTQIRNTIDEIVKTVLERTGDIVDPMIENPNFLDLKLYPYQKRSIHWMLEREKTYRSVPFNFNDEVNIGEVLFDGIRHTFMFDDEKKKLQFRGGALIDEVGLGKTIQMATMSLLNPATDLRYIRSNNNKIFSRATLIMCPNQLCGQWKRELEDKIKNDYGVSIVPILTKVHYDKYTYQDIMDADFVILSYSFLDNKAFLDHWLSKISKNKSYHKSAPSVFDQEAVKKLLNNLGSEMVKDPTIFIKTNVILPLIHWHRIVVDEFHEVHTVDKYRHIANLLPLFDGTYKWCVSGTPFDKNQNCLNNMIEFTTGYTHLNNKCGAKLILNQNIKNYILSNFFRRNTKKSINAEYKLPQLKEKIIWLKFTPTERMMYNAYLANPNNSKFSTFLRQLCCHPKLSDETKNALSHCKTLEDIEKMMVNHYASSVKLADKKVKGAQLKIKIMQFKIKKYERRRQKRILKALNFKPIIESNDIEEIDQSIFNDIDDMDANMSMLNMDDSDSSSDDDDNDKKREVIIINDTNQNKIMKIIGARWNMNKITLDNMYETLENYKKNLIELTKDYEGKKTTHDFYFNVMERIRKTVDKDNDSDSDSNSDSDSDSDSDCEDEETCGICLGEIPENDIGVTKCGHIFCYQCIKTIINQKQQCPYCRKGIKENELYMISYEKNKKSSETNQKEIKDKLSLINKIGTKLANLIYYLKQSNKHTIIFSQWDDLLHKVGEILDSHGIKNTFCRGNVWQRDKAIRTFNNDDDVKVIMLSSESAASGTNLTKASQVILLDPVHGSYEYRRNTEWQAVGRAHRMGQTKEVEVVRFIVKDTVEEEIYNMNQDEDKKFKVDIKIFESNEDSIVISNDMIKEISESAEKSEKKAEEKSKKTKIIRGKSKKVEEKAEE